LAFCTRNSLRGDNDSQPGARNPYPRVHVVYVRAGMAWHGCATFEA
jgi:hypothetical protein